jgi:hypothetical protein
MATMAVRHRQLFGGDILPSSHGALPDDDLERGRRAAAQDPEIDCMADAVGPE